MGNPMSPLCTELFMAKFELELRNKNLLPRIYHRYVDDVFCIMKSNEIDAFLDILNNQYDSIKFSYELEQDNRLRFLDLLLKRTDNKIEIAVYHKPTSTMRTITSDSFCPIQHKHAAFHSFVHRLCNLPLTVIDYKNEYEHIKTIASVNGYSESIVDNLIRVHSLKARQRNASTFFLTNKYYCEKKRVAMNYVPSVTNKLKSKFYEYDMQIVHKNQQKISNLLGSTKDKTDPMNKSGIYSIKYGDCNRFYYGQTKRSIERRFKEHSGYIEKNQCQSAIAEHVLTEGHYNVDKNGLTLLKCVYDDRLLDAYESYYIACDSTAMNKDRGNIVSDLFTHSNVRPHNK